MMKFDELVEPHAPDVVLYHAECMDGFGAAWALWKRFPQTRFVPVKHGFPQPDGLEKQHVVMVDFSYRREDIVALADCAASLQILDHHITAESALADLPYAYFDMNRSGAVLAWEWAHSQPVPWLLQYVQDKDLWHWRLPHSREISAALASYPFEFLIWEQLEFDTLRVEGAGILRSENNLVDKLAQNVVMVSIAGHVVPAVHSPVLASQIGERLAVNNVFGVIWHQREGRRYFSLRSKAGGISVSEIAGRYGGGGHTHAAGFSVALGDDSSSLLNPVSGALSLAFFCTYASGRVYGNVEKSRQPSPRLRLTGERFHACRSGFAQAGRHFAVLTYCAYPPKRLQPSGRTFLTIPLAVTVDRTLGIYWLCEL